VASTHRQPELLDRSAAQNSAELGLWSAEQVRRYLDSVRGDRLHGAWCLLLTTGLRRGELLGLRWSDLDMTVGRAIVRHTVTMVASQPESGTPKSDAGGRTISIDPATLGALRALRKQHAARRLFLGESWLGGSDLVMTEPDGSDIHLQVLSRRFKAQAKTAGLPIIRFHDVRHSYATAALAAGVPVKVLSQRLGHADIGVTLRIYAHVMPGDDEAAAALAANAIFGIP
jgi:integrase